MIDFLKSLKIKNIRSLSGFHNEIYVGDYQGTETIIRVSTRRNKDEIVEEIKVLNQLKKYVNVGEPLKVENSYIFSFKDKQIVFFRKVQGKSWRETKLTYQIHFNAGRELGLLHSKLSELSEISRKSFAEHPDIILLETLPGLYKNELSRVMKELNLQKPRNKEFGLIHGDYLYSNLIYDNDKVTIIDFDDIEYGYYLYDIVVYLFYLLLGGDPENIDLLSNIEVFKYFIKGYRSLNSETVLDLSKIQLLFRIRQLKLLATITAKHKSLSLGEWQKKYLKLCDYQITNNLNFVDIDYSLVAKSINL